MSISIDTRTIQPGDLFIPVKGERFDGRAFIPEAIQKGARVLDVDLARYATRYRKKLKCAVLAITGSAGKTTTKDMLFSVLSQQYKVVKTAENQNNEIGVPLTILNADAETEILIVEMGMRGRGQIRSLSQIARPTHAVITNVGQTHIELLGSQRQIAYAKSELFLNRLPWERDRRVAFLNHSTAFYPLQLKRAQRAGFDVFPFGGETAMAQNVDLCFLVGRQFGLPDEVIKQGVDTYQPSAHRMRRYQLQNQIQVIDDTYNSNPDAMRFAIQQLRDLPGRKLLVMGAMKELGAFSDSAHADLLDDMIDAGISLVFLVGDETLAIQSRYNRERLQWGDGFWVGHFETQDALIRQLHDELKSGDAVLVKGSRSMKMERVVEALTGEHLER